MKSKIALFLILTTFATVARAQSLINYKLVWDYGSLPLEVKLAMGSKTAVNRVAENGIATKSTDLAIQRMLPDGEFKLAASEQAILFLLVKNKGKKKLRFSVAPHSTDPGSASLGFNFTCLCNGHIYEVGPDEVWYRIMRLKSLVMTGEKEIVLKHHIFSVDEIPSQKLQRPHHHN